MLKLIDTFEVRPTKQLTDLKKSDKHRLMDSVLKPEGSKGLIIDFGLSSAGRRINNRIYTPRGQQNGLSSWTTPYAKPILRNHDTNQDPIGRFIDVQFESLDNQAMGFFRNITDFMNFKSIVDSDNPRKIYDALLKHGLLTDERWPGLSRLVAKAGIVNEDAIEKFLNGTYLTFSAGSLTDRYVCGICGNDWFQKDFCDHPPGKMHDGKPGVFITGAFDGEEASVINVPANNTSQLESISFGDSAPWLSFTKHSDSFSQDSSSMLITDAHIETGDFFMKPNENGAQESTQTDTLNVDELISKITDSLSASFDQKLEDKFKEFKGAFGDEVAKPEKKEEPKEAKETQQDAAVPWRLLEMALRSQLGDSQVDESALEDSAFAGPDRVFPVANAAYLAAAQSIVDSVELSDAQKSVIADALSGFEFEDTELADLKQDYTNALQQIDSLREEIAILQQKVEELDKKEATVQNVDENLSRSEIEGDGQLETASVASSEGGKSALNDYEQSVVDRYKSLKDSNGTAAANLFLQRKMARGHLSRNFDITKFIQEND